MPAADWTKFNRFREGLSGAVLGLPFFFLGYHLAEAWLIKQCPGASFLIGFVHAQWLTGIAIAAVLLWYLIARHWLMRIPAWRAWLQVVPRSDEVSGQRWGSAAVMAMAVLLGASILTGNSVFCLTGTAVMQRLLLQRNFTVHPWRDVTEIDFGCSRGNKGRANISYVLVMRDGSRLDISVADSSLEDGYVGIQDSLVGIDFKFDSSRVAKDCPLSPRDPLWRKPLYYP